MNHPPERIHFIHNHLRIDGVSEWLAGFIDRLRDQANEQVQVIDDPAQATRIVFLESDYHPGRLPRRNSLRRHPIAKQYPHKTYVWSTRDEPLPFLPGIYTSLPRQTFNPARHRTFRYWEHPAELHDPTPCSLEAEANRTRDLLYSYLGGPTHPVRARICAMPHPADAIVRQTSNHNHANPASPQTLSPYIELIRRSQFTLCPRGVGTSSYRIFESMRYGSVPVIIADDIVLPHGPDWNKCSVRIPENQLHRLPEILRQIDQVPQRRAAALAAYRDHFAPDTILANIARLLTDIGPANPTLTHDLSFHTAQITHYIKRLTKHLRPS